MSKLPSKLNVESSDGLLRTVLGSNLQGGAARAVILNSGGVNACTGPQGFQASHETAELVAEHGYDTKFGYHVVRLISEVEQILVEGDIDLRRDNDRLKAIRRGEWTEERLRRWFAEKESQLERAYAESTLRATLDEPKIKALLLAALEDHYGSLGGCVVDPDRAVVVLRYWEDRSVADTAHDLGLSESVVRTRARRALQRLRPLLAADLSGRNPR